jgi:phosphohistidine phosphatase
MNLLLVRHAIAYERDPERWRNDADRPLSPKGIRRGRKVACAVARFTTPPERVFSSPLTRARQTAELFHAHAHWPRADECSELSPGEPTAALLALLARDHRSKCVAVVGHQPGLGHLLAACLMADDGPLTIEMKKAGMACITFHSVPRSGRGTLAWLATPKMLRTMR